MSQEGFSNVADIEIPFSDLFVSWQFVWEDHYKGLNKDACYTFAQNINNQMIQQNVQPTATDQDFKNLKTVINFLLSSAARFNVSAFLHCLYPSHLLFGEIMMVLHKDKFTDILDAAVSKSDEMKLLLERNKRELQQLQQIRTQHDNLMKNEKAQILQVQQQLTQKMNEVTAFEQNLIKIQAELNEREQSLSNKANNPPQIPSNLNLPTIQPFNPIPPSSNENNLSTILNKLNAKLESGALGKQKGIRISPPIFQSKVHLSIRSYGSTDFAMWAESQGLQDKESTVFFYLAFREQRMHKNHIHALSKKPDGSPAFNTVNDLITVIVEELKYSDEHDKRLRIKFDSIIKLDKKVSVLDVEFQRIFEIRQMGWPFDTPDDNVQATKTKFVNALNFANELQKFVYHEHRFADWANANTFFQVLSYLRELEYRFHNTPVSLNPLKPTNNDPEAMQCNNCAQGQCSEHDTQKEVRKVNNAGQPLAERTCRNTKCGNKFKPRRVHFVCCSSECNTTYKEGSSAPATANAARSAPSYSSSSRNKKRKPRKQVNNAHNKEVNSSESSGEVSKFFKRFFITPAHVYHKNSEIPTVVPNSLFDTGAGPTLITLDRLKQLNLLHTLVESTKDPEIGGADSSHMVGFHGYATITMKLEDTIGILTEHFEIKCLVYDKLNHDFIIGQDSMVIGVNCFVVFPALDVLLFNATSRMFKKFSSTNRDRRRSINNVKQREHSADLVEKVARMNFGNAPTSSDPKSSTKKVHFAPEPTTSKANPVDLSSMMFDDNESFMLAVPGSTLNPKYFKMFNKTVQNITCNFMSAMENASKEDTALSKVLTEGGLDGLIDTNSITSTGTKILETKRGQVKVGEQLSEKTCTKLIDYVNKFDGNVFDTKTLGKTKHTCDPELKDNLKPENAPPKYMPLNEFMQGEAKVLVTNMLDLGVLKKSTLPANSTIFIVQKSSGKWRLICDLRKFNDRLKDYVVHLPSPYELINKICKFDLFSYVDFPDAYFSMPLSEYSMKHNPVVASVSGMHYNFQYVRMPQGLKPATACFINMLNEIYAPIQDFVVNYLDDSVIGSGDDEDLHFKKLKQFVEITDKAGLKLALAKSVFFTKNITFLNYTVSNRTWSISDNQRTTINALNTDNLTQTKRESLAAFITHFSRFHTGVSFAARKIRDPNSSVKTIDSILDNIKKKLVKASALRAANFKDELLIYTDASDLDCSGVVFQKGKNGKPELVTCFSRKFPSSMINKNIYEKELWCLQQICKTFRYLFLGYHKKTFFNDNKAVVAAQNSRAPSLSCLFSYIKSTFSNVHFKHIPTNKNASDIFTRQSSKSAKVINNINRESLRSRKNAVLPQKKLDDGLKKKIMKVHVNMNCAPSKRLHTTLQTLPQYSFLKIKDLDSILSECSLCAQVQNHIKPRPSAPGITLSRERNCNDVLYIDHKLILTQERKKRIQKKNKDPNYSPDDEKSSILTVLEPISGHTQFFPVDGYDMENVKSALRQVFMSHGPVRTVVADNAPSFTALKSWLEEVWDTQLCSTSAYHPNSNLSERPHLEFEKVMSIYNNKTDEYNFQDWENKLAKAVVSSNSLKHQVHKLAPFEITKNRFMKEIEPVRFHSVGMEHRIQGEKISGKVDKVLKSGLKVGLPVFKRNQVVKVAFPQQEIRFGVVTSYKDMEHKSSVLVSFKKAKAIGVNKNFICIPRFPQVEDDSNIVNPAAVPEDLAEDIGDDSD